jgi:hypothetical protein
MMLVFMLRKIRLIENPGTLFVCVMLVTYIPMYIDY